MEKIPTISIKNINERKNIISKDIFEACQDVGFFTIVDHDLDINLIKKVLNLSAEFFNLSEEIKTPLSKKYPIFKINPRKINRLQASIGEVLASESSIFFQESQSGGGSPNYRGMEANRLLLIIDGVPLNNTIFRSGHLQNSATINPFFIESITLLSGPASVGYGDGAMGGALVFNTLNTENQKATFFNQQFESSSNSEWRSFLLCLH